MFDHLQGGAGDINFNPTSRLAVFLSLLHGEWRLIDRTPEVRVRGFDFSYGMNNSVGFCACCGFDCIFKDSTDIKMYGRELEKSCLSCLVVSSSHFMRKGGRNCRDETGNFSLLLW